MWKITIATSTSCKNNDKIKQYKSKLNLLKSKKKIKADLKDYSVTTSRTNYLDPRITIGFLKKHKISLEKVFSKTLMKKFEWAMDITDDWKF